MANLAGIWIPIDLWRITNLSLIEKIFLARIVYLQGQEGCFASNAYFADFFQVSRSRCTQILKSLEEKKCVKITLERKGKMVVRRTIKILNATIYEDENKVVRILNNPVYFSKQGGENTKQPVVNILNNLFNILKDKNRIGRIDKKEDRKKDREPLTHDDLKYSTLINFLPFRDTALNSKIVHEGLKMSFETKGFTLEKLPNLLERFAMAQMTKNHAGWRDFQGFSKHFQSWLNYELNAQTKNKQFSSSQSKTEKEQDAEILKALENYQ